MPTIIQFFYYYFKKSYSQYIKKKGNAIPELLNIINEEHGGSAKAYCLSEIAKNNPTITDATATVLRTMKYRFAHRDDAANNMPGINQYGTKIEL